MSEIFKLLKNAEAERRMLPKEEAEPPALELQDIPPEPRTAAEPAAEAPRAPTARTVETEFRSAPAITQSEAVEPEPPAVEPEPILEPEPKRQAHSRAAEQPAPPETHADKGRFNLSTADRRIQNVLNPLTIVGEQFRMLRSKLDLLQKQRCIRTVLVTSAVPREGKTFTACGLAGVIAQEPGKRVVLIDADLRKSKSGQGLGLNGTMPLSGLSQVLRAEISFHDALLSSTTLDFFFLPAGPAPQNPSELLSTNALERTLKIAAESFDWVIIDSPPALALADTMLIAPVCDTSILVMHANMTPAKLVTEAINKIGRDRICGVVLNRIKHVDSSRYYYKYYHRDANGRRR